MQIDEYAPQISPTMIGSENSLTELTPMIKSTTTIISVVIVVLILLENVWVIDLSTISATVSPRLFSARFSLIRSKIIMVALIE